MTAATLSFQANPIKEHRHSTISPECGRDNPPLISTPEPSGRILASAGQNLPRAGEPGGTEACNASHQGNGKILSLVPGDRFIKIEEGVGNTKPGSQPR